MSRDDSGFEAALGDVNRRELLLALGSASAVGAAGVVGTAAGQADGGNETATDGTDGELAGEACEPCIDRYSGYLAVGEAGQGAGQRAFDADRTVELLVTDADVLFPDQEDLGEGPGMGQAGNGTAGNATAGNATVGNATVGDEAGNATVAQPEGETAGNETAGNESAEGPGPIGGEGGFPDFYFDPVGVRLRPGDVVAFVTRQDLHTVTAYHPRFFGSQRRVPEGVPGFTSPPYVENDVWYYRFEETGVYDMQCLPHESFGMVMRAVVVEEGSDEVPEEPPKPSEGEMGPSELALRVLTAPELDPENIVDEGTVAWEDLSGVESEPPTF